MTERERDLELHMEADQAARDEWVARLREMNHVSAGTSYAKTLTLPVSDECWRELHRVMWIDHYGEDDD